jgi:hypothetical protein
LLTLVAFGIRCRGLGTWCLAVDEYYFFNSVSNIVDHGIPSFGTGGYYVRGLLVQYLAAPFVSVLADRELALRVVPMLLGVLTIPASYLLARRFVSPVSAFLVATLLALSSWHVEFSRFGRMYSAFQLVFITFVMALYSGYWKGERSGQRWCWLIAAIGTIVHEAAVILPVLIAALVALGRTPTRRLVVETSLVVLALFGANGLLNARDLRFVGGGAVQALVPDSKGLPIVSPPMDLFTFAATTGPLLIVPVALLAVAAWLVWRGRGAGARVSVATAGLLGCSALHQFGIGSIVVLLVALGSGDARRQLWLRRRTLGLFLGTACVAWAAVAAGQQAAAGGIVPLRLVKVMVRQTLLNVPLHAAVLRPFLSVVPLWTCLVGVGAAAAVARGLSTRASHASPAAFLSIVVVASVCVVSMLRTPGHATRYSFFLLPVLLILLALPGDAVAAGARSRPVRAIALAVAPALVLVTEDFNLAHLRAPHAHDANFRLGRFHPLAAHWYARADYESPALFVNERAHDGDIIVTEAVPSALYLGRPFLAFVSRTSPRYPRVAIDGGRHELWTGCELLSDPEALGPRVPDARDSCLWLITGVSDHSGSFKGNAAPPILTAPFFVHSTLEFVGSDERIGVWKLERPSPTVDELRGLTEPDEAQLQVPLHIRPLRRQHAVHDAVAHGAVTPCLRVPDDTVLLRSEGLDGPL